MTSGKTTKRNVISKHNSRRSERRVVTVLFCDVVNSTALADQLDPEDWADIMDEAFDILIYPISYYNGTIARLMGDGVLAFFGAPVAHEDDPQRAILAGLDILENVKLFSEQISRDFGLEFNIRVGINTGPVVVGNIGSDTAFEYTAMGDAVNIAARMEQTAAPGIIQISGNTQKLVAPLFDFEAFGDIDVKGKANAISAYRVLGRKSEPGRRRGIEGLPTPVFGRIRELETLHAALDNLQLGRGSIVTLLGDAGIGKSRLIEETRLAADNIYTEKGYSEFFWIESRGIPYETAVPYGVFSRSIRKNSVFLITIPRIQSE